jgi:hypothetical protein
MQASDIHATDDESAVGAVRNQAHKSDCEIWQATRMVAKVLTDGREAIYAVSD